MPIPPSPALDETISEGQAGHLADHDAIANALNNDTMSLAGPQVVPGLKAFPNGFFVGSVADTFVGPQTFPNGRGLQFLAQTATASTGLLLVPGASVDEALMSSQIIWYGKTGADYNRFAISMVGHGLIFDMTYNGAGAPRPMSHYMDGSVSNAKAGIEMLRFNVNGILMLNGGAPTIDGTAYSGTTMIADRYDTGLSKLRISTRTVSAASVAADASVIDFERANVRRVGFGLNYSGANVDSLDAVTAAGDQFLQFRQDGLSTFGSTVMPLPEVRISGTATTDNKLSFHKNGVERGYVSAEYAAGAHILALDSDGVVSLRGGNVERFRAVDSAPGADLTGVSLQTNNGGSTAMRQVRVGAADSGGAGFRALIVAN